MCGRCWKRLLAGGKSAALPRYDSASNDYFACAFKTRKPKLGPDDTFASRRRVV